VARGQIELNGKGYDLTLFERAGVNQHVHTSQIEIFTPAFSTSGRRSQSSVRGYDHVLYGPFTGGFGGNRSPTDGEHEGHFFDSTAETRYSEGVYLPILVTSMTNAVGGRRLRASAEYKGTAYSLWDEQSGGNNQVVCASLSSTTWGGSSKQAVVDNAGSDFVTAQDLLAHKTHLLALVASTNDHRIYRATDPVGTWTAASTEPTVNLLSANVTENEDSAFGRLAELGSEAIAVLYDRVAGTITFFSSTDVGNTWADEAIDIVTGDGPIGVAVYPGIDDADKLYVLTVEALWEVDTSPSTWTTTRVYPMYSARDNTAQTLAVHGGKLWIGVQQGPSYNPSFITMDTRGGAREFEIGSGLHDIALPTEMLGSVRYMKSSGPFLYASVGGEASGRNARVICWNGEGWHTVMRHGTVNQEINHIEVFSDGTKTSLYLAIRTGDHTTTTHLVSYIDANPETLSGTIPRATTGYLDTRQISGGMPTTNGAFLRVAVDASDLSATNSNEYINADYAVNGAARGGTDLGDFLSGTLSIQFASGAGVEGRNATLRFNLHRDGTTATDTPILHGVELAYRKHPTTIARYVFKVDIPKMARESGSLPRAILTLLETARDLATQPRLRYGATIDRYVKVTLETEEIIQMEEAPSDGDGEWNGYALVTCEEVIR
jgi:hypothetical protein